MLDQHSANGDAAIQLPQELILSINNILNLNAREENNNAEDTSDPLDVIDNDFSPIDILNNLFPNEASLEQITSVQERLAQDERAVQQEIAVLQEQLRRDQDPRRMQQLQEMISELLGQMSRIREKATESEAVVRNITKDIQVLDRAKKNLIQSMTTLKRLQMLVNALTQLQDFVKERKYSDVAQSLGAVNQLAASFKQSMGVPAIMQVLKRAQELQGEIRTQLDADFDDHFLHPPSTTPSSKPPAISSACAIIDVLGPDARTSLISRYVALELKEYRRIFRASDEAGQLDNLARRFAWFRRMLGGHEQEGGRVFPGEWKVGWYLLAKFNEITREDLATLLAKARPTVTVKSLLDDLQLTTDFEHSMANKYNTPYQDILKETTGDGPPQKPMSSSFEPHLSVFIDAQDKAIGETLEPHRKSTRAPIRASLDTAPRSSVEDESQSNENDAGVLSSSTDLFYFYGQSLDQCAKLSVGKPLFDLCAVQKRWLKVYAEDVLMAKLKRPVPSLPSSRKSTDVRFDAQHLKQTCVFINTADYCQTTALELEAKMKGKIAAEFKEKVSFQEERDEFVSVISTCITSQLKEIEAICDGPFGAVSRMQWGQLPQVSGPLAYTEALSSALGQCLEVVKPLVEQKKYVRNLLDKASSLVLAKFTAALVKSRPLKEIGAEQLLIDLQVIKACLTRLPGEALLTQSYTRSLNKGTTRIETLLKVIVTPVDPPEGFILNYVLLIGDDSMSNFQKILDLKGTPKSEQSALLDSFLTFTSTKSDLENTSFLSSLDMDPTPGTTGALLSPNASRANLSDGVFSGLASPPPSRPTTGGTESESSGKGGDGKVFSDLRRFVSFGLRREGMA